MRGVIRIFGVAFMAVGMALAVEAAKPKPKPKPGGGQGTHVPKPPLPPKPKPKPSERNQTVVDPQEKTQENTPALSLKIEEPTPRVTVIAVGDPVETLTVNGVSFDMVLADWGTFRMGCNGYLEEKPEHTETVYPFYIGRTEVTQALWEAVMGYNPSRTKGANNPVESVSWVDCQNFIDRLNQLTGKKFRFPTETEWEYAARGGNQSKGYQYAGNYDLYGFGWYLDNSSGSTHPVATKAPNELGLYDMSGNVYEWTSDLYSKNYSSQRNGGESGMRRIFRGGSYNSAALFCRSSYRNHDDYSKRFGDVGLRLALDAEYVEHVRRSL